MSFSQNPESDFGTNDVHSSEVEESESVVSYEPHYVAHVDYLSDPESTFDESECGEPTRPQRVTLDFTPGQNADLDTPAVRHKVTMFFEFINSQKDLAHLCQIPPVVEEKKVISKKKKLRVPYGESDDPTIAQTVLHDHRDCLTQMTSKSKKVETYPACLSDTESNTTSETDSKQADKDAKKEAHEKATRIQKQAQLSAMCETFEEWDQKHPKSMEPPGPIIRDRAIMMRRQPLERDY